MIKALNFRGCHGIIIFLMNSRIMHLRALGTALHTSGAAAGKAAQAEMLMAGRSPFRL